MSDPVTAPADGTAPATAPAAAPVQPAATPATTSEPAAAPADGTSLLGGGADKPADGDAPPADKPKEGEGEGGDKPAAPKPEDYGDFTLPEGYTLNDEGMATFKEFASGKGWTKDMAQSVIEFAPQYESMRAQQLMTAYQAQGEAWVQTVKADPEIGGADLGAKIAIADRAVAKFGTPELRSLLAPYHPEKNPTGTGLGNHPELVRAFYRAGLTVTEPGPVNTTSPQSGSADHAEILYPSNSK